MISYLHFCIQTTSIKGFTLEGKNLIPEEGEQILSF